MNFQRLTTLKDNKRLKNNRRIKSLIVQKNAYSNENKDLLFYKHCCEQLFIDINENDMAILSETSTQQKQQETTKNEQNNDFFTNLNETFETMKRRYKYFEYLV